MSATAAALATLAIVGQSLGTQPVPAVYQGPGDRYSEAGHVFRALDDVDPRTPPLVRRGFRPWRVTHHAAGRVQVYRTARNLPRYTIRVVYAKHGGPAWDRVRIVVRARR